MTDLTKKVDTALARFDRVTRQLDSRSGIVRDARKRELQRLNKGLVSTVLKIGIVVGLISVVTILVGLVQPIGMFGFLAAIGIAIGIAALLGFMPSGKGNAVAPPADLPNGTMVQRFDSYLYRQRAALPPPARNEIDAISQIEARM